jgi:hypothetical protein
VATSSPAFSSVTSSEHLFSLLKVHPAHQEGLRGLILGAGLLAPRGTDQKWLSLTSFDCSHAALTVYICFIVYRFVNIIA